MPDLSQALPELLISQQTSDELDFEAAKDFAAVALVREWLKEIDERLDVMWVRPGAQSLDGGFWYFVRRNEGMAASYWKIYETRDGREVYCEPQERHVLGLMQLDASKHPDAYRRYRKRQDEARKAREATAEERHREFRELLEERVRSLYEPSIFIPERIKEQLTPKAQVPAPMPKDAA